MNVEDIYGTLYSPADGTVDPAGFCTALVRAATRLGAKVIIDIFIHHISASKIEQEA